MSHLYDLHDHDDPVPDTVPGTVSDAVGRTRAVPTEFTGSPWSDRAQHGGPVNALIAHETRRLVGTARPVEDLRLARLSVELLKPVPRAPTIVETRVVRAGRTVCVVDAVVTPEGADAPAATGRAVFAAPDPAVTVPDHRTPTPLGTYSEEPFTSSDFVDVLPPGFHSHVVHQMSTNPDDVTTWLTSRLTSFTTTVDFDPTLRCAALADMATVVSTRLRKVAAGAANTDADLSMTYLNCDTTLHLVREPVGTWFALSRPDQVVNNGVGFSSVEIYDIAGRLGRASHTVVSSGRT